MSKIKSPRNKHIEKASKISNRTKSPRRKSDISSRSSPHRRNQISLKSSSSPRRKSEISIKKKKKKKKLKQTQSVATPKELEDDYGLDSEGLKLLSILQLNDRDDLEIDPLPSLPHPDF